MMVRYLPGDVIIECQPFARTLVAKEKSKRCDYCFAEAADRQSLKRCTNCKSVYYCSTACQRNDWLDVHKFGECEAYKTSIEIGKDLSKCECERLLLRLYIKVYTRNMGKDRFKLHDGSYRCVDELMDHVTELVNDTKRANSLITLGKRLVDCTVSCKVDVELYETRILFGKIVTNSFSILNHSLNEIGTGLYVEASVFDHSCLPNAAPVFDGTKLQVRALRHIADDEPVLINYLDAKLPTSVRRKQLQEQYYFECNCDRCSSNNDIDDELQRTKVLDETFDDIISNLKDWKDAYLTGIRTLPLYEKIYGEFHPDFTVQLMRMVKVRNMIDEPLDEKRKPFLMQKLINALKVTHGLHHSLVKENFEQSFVEYVLALKNS